MTDSKRILEYNKSLEAKILLKTNDTIIPNIPVTDDLKCAYALRDELRRAGNAACDQSSLAHQVMPQFYIYPIFTTSYTTLDCNRLSFASLSCKQETTYHASPERPRSELITSSDTENLFVSQSLTNRRYLLFQ